MERMFTWKLERSYSLQLLQLLAPILLREGIKRQYVQADARAKLGRRAFLLVDWC